MRGSLRTPNQKLLQNALDQTQGKGNLKAAQWQKLLKDKLDSPEVEHEMRFKCLAVMAA